MLGAVRRTFSERKTVLNIGTNGTSQPKTSTDLNRTKRACGSTVSFHNIQYNVHTRSGFFCKAKRSPKEILMDLNGIMRPGLNAILGPTGSGKSSFLDILAGRKDPLGLSGEVLIDGAPQPPNFKCLSGYVVQEDVVMGTLTVRQNLSFSAALRLPTSVPQSEKEARVEHLIRELCLSKVADSKVGSPMTRGISGGERKRTNIGMELIIDPAVLFLDEPTTGLDASTANSVLLLLKRMASHGRTIIMSIHQPRYSIYRLFDTLTLLVGGRMVYHGPAPSALDYFSNIGYPCEPHNNPADFFLDVLNGVFTKPNLTFEELGSTRQNIEEHLVEEYKNSSYSSDARADLRRILQNKERLSPAGSRSVAYNSSFLHQLRWVFQRTFQNLMLTPQTSVAQVGVNVFLALIVGAIFFSVQDDQSGLQNRMGALFFITTNQCFSTVSAAELFIAERNLFVHEYISGYYRVSVYFLSKILCDLIMRTVTSVIFSVIVYFLIGKRHRSACRAKVLNPSLRLDTFLPVSQAFSDVVSIQALKINEFAGLRFCEEPARQPANASCRGEQYLDYLGIRSSSWGLWENHVALAVMMVVFLFIAYLKLRYIRKFT
uniref:Broad substrate specificity ATP-binding cassette transporter ABCG2 n=1 Tax=Fundulus heteroclitus TaxID=8078 RepID=A0A3Q2UL68_FUNHE